MKIMHLCTGYPITFNGGITNYVRSLANEQAKQKVEVIVIGGKDPKFDQEKNKFKYIEYTSLLKPFSLSMKKNNLAYSKIKNIIKRENPDLIHIHMMLDIDIRLGDFLKKENFKYIISLHDYSFICPRINMFRNDKVCSNIGEECKKCANFTEQNIFVNKIYNTLKLNRTHYKLKSPNFEKMFQKNKELLENAAILLPVSKRVKEIYENAGIKNNYKILHIGNVTANQFKPYHSSKITNTEKIKIVFLGNFSKIKGGREYLKLAKDLDREKFDLYFLGRSKEDEKQKMKENNIIDKGPYKQVELANILKEYDLGCVLSIWEDNAPQVVMELLNNNIPVIGTKMGGIPDFVKEKENGFLYNPYNKESYQNLINTLNQITKEEIEQLKENIRPTLTPQEHFKEIKQIYNLI